MTAVCYMLLVDGSPIAFGSASCTFADFSSLSCAEDSDPTTSGFPTAAADPAMWPTIAPGTLMLGGWSWTESVEQILQGELQVGAIDFGLYDRPLTIQGTLRDRGVTWLGTRKVHRGTATIVNTRLSASITASALSLDVDAPSLFTNTPQVLYVDREAILVDSLAGSTFTINASGRGVYNSLAAIHAVDDDNTGYAPRVFGSFPGFDGRRVSLWQIDTTTGVAVRRWVGYCSGAGRKGTGYELQCEHAIITERARPIGVPIAAPRLRGYNTVSSYVELSWEGGPTGGLSTQDFVPNPPGGRVVNNKREFLDRIATVIRARLDDNPSWPGSITLAEDGPAGAVRFHASVQSVTQLTGTLSIDGDRVTDTSTETVDPHIINALGDPMPPVIVIVSGGEAGETPITSLANLPASGAWLPVPHADGHLTTTLTPVMRGQIDDGHWAVVEPRSTVDNGAGSTTTNPGPFLIGPSRIETVVNEHDARSSLKTHVPVLMTPQVLVTSPHWLLALRRGFVESSTFANSGADPRDWDWSRQGDVLRSTQSRYAGMQIYLDGKTSIDNTFRDRFKANACGIGIRNGKLSPFVFRAPLPTDTSVMTVTSSQYARGTKPQWKRLRNALVNVVDVDCGRGLKITVRDKQSGDRYGYSAPVQIKLADNEIRGSADFDPFVIVGEILSRFIGMFGNPVSMVTFSIGPSRLDEAAIGDFVTLSDWISPDGSGSVGISGTVGQVIEKSPKNVGGGGESSVQYSLLLYGLDGLSGFAPAVRAASLDTNSVARDGITAALNYLSSDASDYAGSNLLSYAFFDTFVNDGGVSWVSAGDKGRLFERNSTSPRAPESVTVLSVTPSSTPGSSKIVFTTGVDVAWSAIAAAGNLDYVPDRYATATTGQRRFCYVATSTPPNVIGGTADGPKVFA